VAWWAVRSQTQTKAPVAAIAARTATAAVGNIDRVIRVTGQTAATDFVNITAPMMKGPEATREMILIKVARPGSLVKKGMLVAQVDAQTIADHVDDLGDTIETAQADIRTRRAEQAIELENLQQSLRVAKSEADKARLEYNGSETQTDIQRQLLKLTLDEADARYKQLQSDVVQKKASHEAEIHILDLTLQRHTRHRDRHKRDLQAFSVYASMDGLAVMQQIWRGSEMGQVQQGDRIFPGQPFMKIVNTKSMQVEGNLNQAESGDFRIGQTGRIHLDAFKDVTFAAKVHSIGALANGGFRNSFFVRNVPIRVDILGNDPRLIPDLSAGADIVVESASNQVLVPLSALKTENGKPVVYVKDGEGFQPREVTTGVRSEIQVAIASGIHAGDVVRID